MLAIIVGLIFMALGLWGLIAWWSSFVVVFQGLIPPLIIMGGLLAVVAGVTSVKDSMEARSETAKSSEKKES